MAHRELMLQTPRRRPAHWQFDLAGLFRALLLISFLLAVLRLPGLWCFGIMALIGSIALARLGQGSFGAAVFLGMYGSIAGVWLAFLGSCLVQLDWTRSWGDALVASWICLPPGLCVGAVVGCFTRRDSLYQSVPIELARLRERIAG